MVERKPPHTTVWVQGMKDAEEHKDGWELLLYRRLLGQYDLIERGSKTKDAEDALGIEAHSYYGVGVPYPQHGLRAIAAHAITDDDSIRIAPFDTGGMVLGHTILKDGHATDQASRVAITNRWTRSLPFDDEFNEWLADVYGNPTDYLTEQRPTDAHADEVDANAPKNDRRAWTWEARVPVTRPYPVEPIRLYLSERDRTAYQNWVVDHEPLAAEAHFTWLQSVISPGADPISRMWADLKGGW